MTHVHHEGADIWWTATGSGPALLLLNGYSSDSDMWFRLEPQLTPRFRVIRMDNRGVGRSDAPEGAYPMSLMAADAAAVLDAADEESADVIGISMGSCIAQELALNHPRRVRSLVLAASNPGPRHGVSPAPETLALLAPDGAADAEAFLRKLVPACYHPTTSAERIDEDIARRLQRPPKPAGIEGQMRGASGWDRYDDLASIRVPTLILHGRQDLLDPVDNGRILAQALPGSSLVELDNCSHQIFTDQEQPAADVILDFLGKVNRT
jgi:pimeloyl-ACP methyl ester carboxylesterase